MHHIGNFTIHVNYSTRRLAQNLKSRPNHIRCMNNATFVSEIAIRKGVSRDIPHENTSIL